MKSKIERISCYFFVLLFGIIIRMRIKNIELIYIVRSVCQVPGEREEPGKVNLKIPKNHAKYPAKERNLAR